METRTRINKWLADQKIASRREADRLIAAGVIFVNGEPATIGQTVGPGDTVEVRSKGQSRGYRYLAYYKGRGIITHSPAEGEVDIESRLKKDYGITGVSPIGRLDKDSEGLIIMSNDGRITRALLDPESACEKEYNVQVDKPVTKAFLKLMEMGVDIEGYHTKPAKVELSPKNVYRFSITLTEGKKHQIRRMCAALGYQIKGLKRVRISTIALKSLKPNQYRKIAGEELQEFLTALGIPNAK